MQCDISKLYDAFKITVREAIIDGTIPEQKIIRAVTEEIKGLFGQRTHAKRIPLYSKFDKLILNKSIEAHVQYLKTCEENDDELLVKPREAHKRVKQLSGKQSLPTKTNIIKDKNGNLLFEAVSLRKRWFEYTKELYDNTTRSKLEPFNFSKQF